MIEIINVFAAAIGSFVFGAVWYMALSKQWMAASGVECDENGNPKNSSDPRPYITSFIAAVLVAGMLRHMFAMTSLDSVWDGMVSGFGVGAFFITPWIAMNNGFSDRPFSLTIIDGGYAICGCTLMGAILMLF